MATNPETKRASSIVIWAVVLVFLVLGVIAIRSLTRERVGVRVAEVSHQDLVRTVATNGKVEPIGEFQAHAPVPGVVKDIFVNVGDTVRPGQRLVRMDDADPIARLATATSALRASESSLADVKAGGSVDERNGTSGDLARAQQQLKKDTADLATLQQLQQKGAASAAEVNGMQQRLIADQTTLHGIQQHSTHRFSDGEIQRAEAQVADSQAAVAAAKSSVANADITSPISGTVYSIPVSQYDYVPGGEDLLDVADLNHIQVRAYFDEPEIGNLAVGQPVRIVWDAKPNVQWHGHITRAPSTVIAYGTRNVGECIISVDDSKGDLELNANVTVTVTTSSHPNVLSIPREALHTDGAQSYVYRVVDRKLVRTPVQVGVVNLTRVEITSGLAEHAMVALSATTNRDLADGLEVTPVR